MRNRINIALASVAKLMNIMRSIYQFMNLLQINIRHTHKMRENSYV